MVIDETKREIERLCTPTGIPKVLAVSRYRSVDFIAHYVFCSAN